MVNINLDLTLFTFFKKTHYRYIEIFPSQKSEIRTHNGFFRGKMMGYPTLKQDSESVFDESELNEALRPTATYESDKENGKSIQFLSFETSLTCLFMSSTCWREVAGHTCNLHMFILALFTLQKFLSKHLKSLGMCRSQGVSPRFTLFI